MQHCSTQTGEREGPAATGTSQGRAGASRPLSELGQTCGCHQVGHLCSQEVVLQVAELGAQEGALLLLDITQHLPHAAAQLGSPALHMPAHRQERCI